MELSNKRSFHRLAAAALLLLFTVASGCTLDSISDEDISDEVTNEDLEAASQILGESLSADNSGVILSLNDALTSVSSDGFTATQSIGTFQKGKSPSATVLDDDGRGRESNYSYTYDPETGIHTVSFNRIIDNPLFMKEVSDTLEYIFRDSNGEFVEEPRAEKNRIESIDFHGYRTGTVETPKRNSSFTRIDTFFIDGVSDASAILQIDGVHNGNGSMEINKPNGDFLIRNYSLEINFLNIEIDKQLAEDGLEQGVTGTLSWEMIIDKNNNGSESSKTMRGTVEMNGDGTALLRFRDYIKVFQVNLDDGDVKDRDREYEGRVISVNEENRSITLRSGRQIFFNDETEFDFDDGLSSMQEVKEAVDAGRRVWSEGEGSFRDGRFLATEAEFELHGRFDDDDEDDDRRDFEQFVTGVNVSQGTFELAGRVIIQVDENTEIDDDGDYTTLQQVADALDRGIRVEAEGEVERNVHGSTRLRAVEVKFESDDDDDGDDD